MSSSFESRFHSAVVQCKRVKKPCYLHIYIRVYRKCLYKWGDGPACTLGTPLLRDPAPSLSPRCQAPSSQVKNQEQMVAGEEPLLSPQPQLPALTHCMDGDKEKGEAPEQDMQEYQNKLGKESCTRSACTRTRMRWWLGPGWRCKSSAFPQPAPHPVEVLL